MYQLKILLIGLLLSKTYLSGMVFHPQIVEVNIQLEKRKQAEIKEQPSVQNGNANDYLINERLYFEHIPVDVQNVLKSQLTLYENEYYSLPRQLKNSISKITITADNLNNVCGISSRYQLKGCARSEYNDLFLDDVYRYGDLLHESIHLYSYQNDRVFTDEFASIYQEEGQQIQVQAGNVHNVYEFYVSAYLIYLQNPNLLAAKCPRCKAYFDRT